MRAMGMGSYRRFIHGVLRIGTLVALLLPFMVVLGPSSSAETLAQAAWRGEYYNNSSLSGSPALLRDDASINFDWGGGSPGGGVNADHFSVRWTRYVSFGAGTYSFSVTVDDGARLWVDDQLLIDQWHDGSATTYSASKWLSAGYHSIRLEYYENAGAAVCKLWWGGDGGGAVTGWQGEYYNNTWLGNTPGVVRTDGAISFDWGHGSPAAGINADNFSVRWTRDVYFGTSQSYTFSATVDDGVRVWVGGSLVIDKWYPQSRTTHMGTIWLAAGTHQVRVEYFEATGEAVCIVSFSGAGGVSAQEIIVDNQSSSFIWGGPSSGWYGRYYGYAGHLYWTWNSRTTQYNWGKWFPYVPTAGNWDVYVYIPSRYHGTKNATYRIYHSGTWNDTVVNQNNYYNQWVSLGTYYFSGGAGEYVFLNDVTGETYATRFVGFDAVKFVRRDGVSPGPTVPPTGCSITPVLGFGRIWSTYSTVRSRLGCPTEVERNVWAAEETFQGGYMFWRQDTTYIYAVYSSSSTWQGFDDTWTEGEADYDPSIVPPWGYYQPVRGFGKVWRLQPGVRTTLGWATTQERGFTASVQQFEGGLMFWSNLHGIFVLYNDGRWERYY